MNYPPIVYLDNDVPKGMVVDLTRAAITKKMGREVRINLLPWDVAQKRVADGKADIVGPMARSPQREEIYDFTQPCMTCEYSLFVRENEIGVRDVTDLTGKSVGVTPGGFPRQFLSEQPGIKLVMIDNYASGIEQLLQSKIQVLAADRWVAAYYIQEHGIRGISVVEKPFATREHCYAVHKGNSALINSINQALDELRTEGTVDSIVDSWAPKKVVILTREQMRRIYLTGGFAAVALLVIVLSRVGIFQPRSRYGNDGLQRNRCASRSPFQDTSPNRLLRQLLFSTPMKTGMSMPMQRPNSSLAAIAVNF